MDAETEHLGRQMSTVRTVNARLVREIEELGGAVEVVPARVEHFFAYLVDLGVITQRQHVEEQLLWEKHLQPQLRSVRDKLKAAAQLVRDQADKTKQITRSSRLILPPGARGK